MDFWQLLIDIILEEMLQNQFGNFAHLNLVLQVLGF